MKMKNGVTMTTVRQSKPLMALAGASLALILRSSQKSVRKNLQPEKPAQFASTNRRWRVLFAVLLWAGGQAFRYHDLPSFHSYSISIERRRESRVRFNCYRFRVLFGNFGIVPRLGVWEMLRRLPGRTGAEPVAADQKRSKSGADFLGPGSTRPQPQHGIKKRPVWGRRRVISVSRSRDGAGRVVSFSRS